MTIRPLIPVAVVATVGAIIAACYDVPGAFVCSRDDQCGPTNFCEPAPTPWCSRLDGTCPSGRRFRPFAGDGRSDTCVDPGGPERDGSSGNTDLAGAPTDGGTTDGATSDGGTAGCALPQLLVAAEDLSGPGAVGNILRYTLDGNGILRQCGTLRGGGALGATVDAVAWISPTRVATASRDRGYQLIDSDRDLVVASAPSLSEIHPVDIFPIRSTTDEDLIAVASGPAAAQPYITEIDVFAGSTKRTTWTPAGLGLSTVYSMTRSLLNPRHLFATNASTSTTAATDVDPWGPSHTTYLDDTTSSLLVTIASLESGGARRTAWIGTNVAPGAYFTDDTGGTPSIVGPVTCATPPAACTLIHVVPDPTLAGRLIGLCDDNSSTSPNARYVVRFDGATCTTLLDGRTLPSDRRLFRLAIGN